MGNSFGRLIAALTFIGTSPIFLASPARSATLGEFQLYGWTIGAYSHDQGGGFSHCGASVPYKNGISLVFVVGADFHWRMAFANSAWRLALGSTYPVQYQIDTGTVVSATAVALSPEMAAVDLLDSQSLFEAFRRGYQLKVGAAGETFVFNLTNSSKALAATINCTQRFAEARSKTNPFESTPSPAPASGERPAVDIAHKAEATILIANVLSASGVQGFSIAEDKVLEGYAVVWTAPGLLGGVQIMESATVDQAVAMLIISDTSTCKGTFASAKVPSDTGNTARLRTACEEVTATGAKQGFQINYTILPRSKGGIYVLATSQGTATGSDIGANPEAEQASGQLYNASLKFVRAK